MKRSRHHIAEGTLRTYIRSVLLEYPQDVCPKCGADRSKTPGKKHCGKCGVKMGLCPKCEKPLGDKPTQKFCNKCGEKLASPDSGKTGGEPSPDTDANKELEEILSVTENLLKELESDISKAPERPSDEEKRLYDEIMGPYFAEQDKILEVDPETPQELRAHLKNARENIKKFKSTFTKFYKAVKAEGKVLSKPMLEMLITSLKKDIEIEKNMADQKAGHEKNMADQKAKFDKMMDALNDEIYKSNPHQRIIDKAFQ